MKAKTSSVRGAIAFAILSLSMADVQGIKVHAQAGSKEKLELEANGEFLFSQVDDQP